ncbi:MAG: hypothetical protein JWM33_1172 [Caulobacteraceae bacterium]|nr:hypothetical protein [Caulobacteraceae bacterium]
MALALTPIEAEQLRDLRSRLNRVPAGPLGDKSVGPLSKGFFVTCGRVGLEPQSGGEGFGSVPELKTAIAQADLIRLKQIVARLQSLQAADFKIWRMLFGHGVLQAILTRRLILGGKEQPTEGRSV